MELGFLPSLSSSLIDALGIKDYDKEQKFELYGMETYSFAIVCIKNIVSFFPTPIIFLAIYCIAKPAALIFPNLKLFNTIAGHCSKAIFWNYSVRFVQEYCLNMFISSFMSFRKLFDPLNARNMLSISSIETSVFMGFVFIILAFLMFGIILGHLICRPNPKRYS